MVNQFIGKKLVNLSVYKYTLSLIFEDEIRIDVYFQLIILDLFDKVLFNWNYNTGFSQITSGGILHIIEFNVKEINLDLNKNLNITFQNDYKLKIVVDEAGEGESYMVQIKGDWIVN